MGSVCYGYMCILLYVKLIWCSGFPEIYAQLGGSVCLLYVCIFLYVQFMQCTGFAEIYIQFKEGSGVSLPWVYVHSALCKTYRV